MRKYLITLLGVVVFSMIISLCYYNSSNRYFQYNHTYRPIKLVKEVVLNINDTLYRGTGYKFKQIYRKYNYVYSDSIERKYLIGDSIWVIYYMSHDGNFLSEEHYKVIK